LAHIAKGMGWGRDIDSAYDRIGGCQMPDLIQKRSRVKHPLQKPSSSNTL
jgi:hypothetical protein